MPTSYRLRPAVPADIPGIQVTAQVTWEHTYGSFYSEAYIRSFLERAYSTANLEASIARDEASAIRRFLVAETEAGVVGYAQLAEPKAGEAELYRIYVRPECQGQGIGKALLEKLIAADPEIGRVTAWVEKDNRSGIAFYRSSGFRFEEDTEEKEDGQTFTLSKFVLNLQDR
ncbi:GNAT family N-acetyltransferase [Cohnella thermotolerans]|uniref:GNAT family N-acetyltransferase n=1 Tax=Cohnella thermotolerans TaxID=329858 RepID=UPI0006855F0B|nr:GNAT family N-acetyltransferase [Cohnella thermotolerans]